MKSLVQQDLCCLSAQVRNQAITSVKLCWTWSLASRLPRDNHFALRSIRKSESLPVKQILQVHHLGKEEHAEQGLFSGDADISASHFAKSKPGHCFQKHKRRSKEKTRIVIYKFCFKRTMQRVINIKLRFSCFENGKVLSKGQLDLIPGDPRTHRLKDRTGILLGLFQLSRYFKTVLSQIHIHFLHKSSKTSGCSCQAPHRNTDSSSSTSPALLSRCVNAAAVTSWWTPPGHHQNYF